MGSSRSVAADGWGCRIQWGGTLSVPERCQTSPLQNPCDFINKHVPSPPGYTEPLQPCESPRGKMLQGGKGRAPGAGVVLKSEDQNPVANLPWTLLQPRWWEGWMGTRKQAGPPRSALKVCVQHYMPLLGGEAQNLSTDPPLRGKWGEERLRCLSPRSLISPSFRRLELPHLANLTLEFLYA